MTQKIINLTQHPATAEQLAVGVVDLQGDDLAALKRLLTFEELPDESTIRNRVWGITTIAEKYAGNGDDAAAMIGGALWLMAPLASALRAAGIQPLFAFSRRETVEERQPDGSVRKTAVFRHAGFVPAVAVYG